MYSQLDPAREGLLLLKVQVQVVAPRMETGVCAVRPQALFISMELGDIFSGNGVLAQSILLALLQAGYFVLVLYASPNTSMVKLPPQFDRYEKQLTQLVTSVSRERS